MRLIDADELLKAPFRIEGKFGGKYPFEAITVRMIEAATTVEAAPVVHGRWETNSDRPDTLICGHCCAGFDMWKHESKDFHYCPNCGSKMD